MLGMYDLYASTPCNLSISLECPYYLVLNGSPDQHLGVVKSPVREKKSS